MSDEGSYRIKKMPPGLEHLFRPVSRLVPWDAVPALPKERVVVMRECLRTALPFLPAGRTADDALWLLTADQAAAVRVIAILRETASSLANVANVNVHGPMGVGALRDIISQLRDFATEAARRQDAHG